MSLKNRLYCVKTDLFTYYVCVKMKQKLIQYVICKIVMRTLSDIYIKDKSTNTII